MTLLDFATEESALQTKRRELASMVAEGRQVVVALTERQTALGHKVEDALAGIQRLQEQINAIDVVMGLVDHRTVTFQPPRPTTPVLEVVASHSEPAREYAPLPTQRFKPVAYLKCLADGHDFMNSRSMPGRITCRRCKVRRSGS